MIKYTVTMKIFTVPHPILATKTKPVEKFDKKLVRLIDQMKKTLEEQIDPPGVGLAAPQVGVSLRIFLMKPTKKSPITVFINPDLIGINPHLPAQEKTNTVPPSQPDKEKTNTKLEGCLSLPRIWGSVAREKTICIGFNTIAGEKKQACFSGFEAVIIQHELDHLDGVIFTQHVVEQNSSLYEEKNGELAPLTIE